MRVSVFGASGKVGRLVVEQLLDDDWEVTVFVHSSSPFSESKNLHIVSGDVHSLEDVRRAVRRSDVVISTLGSWGTKQKDIVSSGIRNIIAAMSESGVQRVISLTGSDALTPADQINFLDRVLHFFIKLSPAHKILADGEEHLKLLQGSQLDWTVLRSPVMNDHGDSQQFSVGFKKPRPWATINRQSVAAAMVELIDTPSCSKKAPFITRKHGP